MGMFDDLIPQRANKSSGMFDDLIPTDQGRREIAPPSLDRVPTPNVSPRWGDSVLKPIFGTNPATEVYDTFIDPFVPDASAPPSRPIGERAKDAAAFAMSLPIRILSRGESGAGDVATALGREDTGRGLAQSEQSFVQHNAPQLGAVQAAGDAAMGTLGMPNPVRVPMSRERVAPPPAVNAVPSTPSFPSSGPARARAYVDKLDELGISRHGPAIAQAGRDAEGLGTVAKVVEGMPFVSGPLRRSTREFVDSATRAGDNIAQRYSPGGGNIDKAGGSLRSSVEAFKNERSIAKADIEAMSDAEIARLASTPPRDLGSFKTAADARFEHSWRQIPEEMRKGASFKEEPRLMGDMPETRKLIQTLHDENVQMMNAQRMLRNGDGTPKKLKVNEETADLLPTAGDAMFKKAVPFRGGVLGTAMEDVAAGRWKGTLQTMRNLRTKARLQASAKSDAESNVIDKANLDRLKSAIDTDMKALVARLAKEYREGAKGPADLAKAQMFERAGAEFAKADAFYRRYKEVFKDLQPLGDVKRDPEAIGKIISAARAGANGNPRLLMQLRRTQKPEVLDDTASAVFMEMGRPGKSAGSIAQESQWSITKAVGEWDGMSPAGRKGIFGHRPELYKAMEKYMDVARGMKDYEALRNSSASGTHGLVGSVLLAGPMALAANVIGNIYGIALTAGTNYGLAKWLTSPAYINWLTRATQVQRDIASGAIPATRAAEHTTKLVRHLKDMVNRDRDLSPEVASQVLIAIDQATKQSGAVGQ
jgi:hypothetical protein